MNVKYKIKNISSLKKRFLVLKSGLIKYKKSNLRHILTKKSSKRRKKLKKRSILSKNNSYLINKYIYYK
ncbi:50S ribosomal protein L35 [endosymbiont of Pachyrhynchus infernalis]|uniref:50S ribosomal protein L35 n=1 Tax=endosymbiont of Pachyrhynchus infernalis TaxID=1971488 RepID=UPI000DC6F16F|nr:50S ribosomal protein L35 [endosymbiont of Pachyrhynchus infernalis]BBA84866.1 50S ribosomal protein L35 [endosymbiont of Pachyrhynchus infernalis]